MSITSRGARLLVFAALVGAALTIATERGEAHKAITSKYTYNDDVFPIFKAKCARCHVQGGVAPMSLMTYDEAFPWAESIRAELVAAHMPPWNADEGFGAIRQAHTLSPHEIDVILTWATGGNPRGQLDQKLPAVTLVNDWVMGKPDLALPVPSEFTVAADKMEDWHDFTIATGTSEPRWIRAVDLLPGNPQIVRSATVFVMDGAGTAKAMPSDSATSRQDAMAPEQVLARWVPGHDPEQFSGAALRLPAGAQLGVRVHYKKTWQFEGKPMTDRSTVGLYFAAAKDATEVLTLPLVSEKLPPAGASDRSITFSRTLTDDLQALALSPDAVPANIGVQVEAVRPDGSRAPLIRLSTRADWSRRYWFDRPLSLPKGTKIEVTAKLEDPDISAAAFGAPPPAPADPAAQIRLSLNLVRAGAKPVAP
jgi:mono/diheme cytochrome c family protein